MGRQGHDTTCPDRVGIMTTLPVSNFQFRISSFDSRSAPRSSFVLVAVPPPLLLHRRIFRLTLTPASARNSIISKFRRFRRTSRSAVQGPFFNPYAPHRAPRGQCVLGSFFSARAGPNVFPTYRTACPGPQRFHATTLELDSLHAR